MRKLLVIFVLLVMAFGSIPSQVLAQDSGPKFSDLSKGQKEEIASLIEEAKAAYDRGKFESSLENFQRAFDIYPHPDIFYRMALCYQGLGEDSEAVRYYRLFLSAVPDAPERPRIEKIIETIESRVSDTKIFVESDPKGAAVYIDDVANGVVGTTPANIRTRPGNYRVIVEKANHERVEELVNVKAGETIRLRYQLKKLDPHSEKFAEPPSTRNTGGIVTLVAVGVGASISTLVFYSLHGDKKTELEQLEKLPPQDVSRERIEETETQKNVYLGLTVGSAVIATGSLVWAYFLYRDSSAATAMAPTNSPSVWWDEGLRAGWTWGW